MELFASAPGLAVEESYVRLLNHLPGLAYRCRVGRTDPIVSERLEYTLEFVSKGSYDLLGIPAEDMVRNNNNTIERMMHPDDLQKTRRNMYDSIVAHQPYQVMYRVSLPSGRLKWIWDQGEGVFDADGELRYLEGLMMDISEQKFQELELKEENRQLKASVSNLYGLGNIVGKSEAMRRVYGLILKAAETDTNVIIYGETGSGKDLVAKAIHEYSARKGNYVPVNCGAIPEQLLESEFFGHTKGAFSGAHANKEGYIGAAHNGTLFLDEIGELPIHLQVKLLRAIENKMYTCRQQHPQGLVFPSGRGHEPRPFKNGFGKKDALGFLLPRTCAFHHIAAPARAARGHPAACRGLHGAQGHQLRPAAPSAFGDGTLRLARQRARAAQFSRPLHGFRGCGP